jgi:mannonate dehydratase
MLPIPCKSSCKPTLDVNRPGILPTTIKNRLSHDRAGLRSIFCSVAVSLEVVPLVKDRLIDFIRCRVAATGGITPIKKLTTLCEIFGVRTAFQEGGENDPINQIASYHVDISSTAFGIQEENHFPPIVHEMFPGIGEIRRGYLYGSGKPGLGIDIDETLAAKNPLGPIKNGGAYGTDRTIDGAVVKP